VGDGQVRGHPRRGRARRRGVVLDLHRQGAPHRPQDHRRGQQQDQARRHQRGPRPQAQRILDLGAVKANVEKVKQAYVEKGFFLAEVTYGLKPVEDEPGKVDILIVVSEAAETVVRKITFIGNQAFTTRSCASTC
jgi:hypothetical protein